MNRQELGLLGENLACNHLIREGYEILERNYRYQRAEVDLIAKKKQEIVFVEVKTRETSLIGEPYQAVTRNKQRQIIQVANHFMQKIPLEFDSRFDIISIVHNSFRSDLEHIPAAFFPTIR